MAREGFAFAREKLLHQPFLMGLERVESIPVGSNLKCSPKFGQALKV